MGRIAILFGVLLTILGGGFYGYLAATSEDKVSITALIPAFFGIPLIICGVLAAQEKLRMHVMHVAALLGLIGFAVPGYRVVKSMLGGGGNTLALVEQGLMSVLCLVFVALCVKSFIDARRARSQQQVES